MGHERLLRLYELRNRVDAEIQVEEDALRYTPPRRVAPDVVRRWAQENGHPIGIRGAIAAEVWDAYEEAHRRA